MNAVLPLVALLCASLLYGLHSSEREDLPVSYPVTDDGAMEFFPLWSPADSLIAYSTGDVPKVDLHFIRPNAVGHVVHEGKGVARAWFPDGRRVLVTRPTEAGWRLMAMAAGGEEQDFGVTLKESFTDFLVAPDGQALLWGSDREGGGDLFRLRFGDGSVDRLTHQQRPIAPCAWSAGGDSLLVCVRDVLTGETLFGWTGRDGGSLVGLRAFDWSQDPPAERPALSADGARMAYVTSRSDLFALDLAGGKPTRLDIETGFLRRPSLSPDGTRLVLPIRARHGVGSPTIWDLWIVDVDAALRRAEHE